MKELLEEIDRIYDGLQHLQLQPTKSNTAIIFDALTVLEKVYAKIQETATEQEQEEVTEDVHS